MLDLRRLVLLRELRARGTISAVAEELNYTPSAVSQQLAQLQREAGVTLLERVGRGVRLTDAGRVLVDHTEAILARLEQAEADLAAAAGEVRGRVRIAAFQTAARALVGPVITALGEQHPHLRAELLETEAEEALPALRTGIVDVVIAEEYEHAPRRRDRALERHDIALDRLLLAIHPGHPLAAAGGPIDLRALAGERWAITRAGTAFADMVVRTCRIAGGFEPDVRHRANDVRIFLELAQSNLAVALIPAMGRYPVLPGVELRPLAGLELARHIFAAVRRGSASRPAIAAALDALRARSAELGLTP